MANAGEADWGGAIQRAKAYAPFLARSLDRQPELAAMLAKGDHDAAFAWTVEQGQHEDTGVGLRRQRLALATTLAIGDLAGAFPLARVVRELTEFADHALGRAIAMSIAERTGAENSEGLIALALGKQGAGELNYSSDIDPILLFDPDNLPRRASDDPGDAAQRYGRRIVKLLSENTPEGYVLRVDLRLRPASEISPLVVRLASALAHYQSAALAWERAAFIRARAAAGDVTAGEEFLSEMAPFVWRHALDFGAIEEIRALTLRIRENNEGASRPGPGFDVKKGRGGIREIEFFAQTHQLIHGGRDPSLRVRGTREALNALALAGRIDPGHAHVLGEGYDRLRVIEHRLQMVHDRQTHSLPDGDALEAVAKLDGISSGADLVAELTDLTEGTARIYEELIGKPEVRPVATAQLPEGALQDASNDRAEALTGRIESWRDGRYQSLRSPQALSAFEAIMPILAKALLESDDPDRAIVRIEKVLEGASSAINLFHLLRARPALLDRFINTLTLAPMLADELAREPALLDTLLDRHALELPGSVEEIIARIERKSMREDFEAMLDSIRMVTSELRFTLGVQLIEGLADPIDIAAALSRIAEAGLQIAVRETASEFERVHGRIEEGELVVLGLGRFGGGALTHTSDLDIIYLFIGDFAAESDGGRPLGATHYFNRLASRVSAALSVPTARGALYEVDTRLRPQGKQGPLAVSCEAFAKYQREAAWTWEHMALARARMLVGSDSTCDQLDAILQGVIVRPRKADELLDAVLTMRDEMAKHKSPGGRLDVKLLRGGLVDFEFLVHFLQLRDAEKLDREHSAAFKPDLGTAIPALVQAGLLPRELVPDYDLMTRILVAGRLLTPGGAEPPQCAAAAFAKACQVPDYQTLLQQLDAARQRVAKVWNTIFGQTLDVNPQPETPTEPQS